MAAIQAQNDTIPLYRYPSSQCHLLNLLLIPHGIVITGVIFPKITEIKFPLFQMKSASLLFVTTQKQGRRSYNEKGEADDTSTNFTKRRFKAKRDRRDVNGK